MVIFCWEQAESRRFADLGTRIVGLMLFFGGELPTTEFRCRPSPQLVKYLP